MGDRTLLCGRAGTGKTFELTQRLAAELRAGRERDCVLLVPTFSQASHLKRLLLTRFDELAGFFDESVVTFTGLAELVGGGRSIGDLLSGLRQDLLLRRALHEIASPVLTPLTKYAGFRRAAREFLKELKQNGRPAPELADRMAEVATDRSEAVRDRILAFRDLLLSYERLREAGGFVDHEDYLRIARDELALGRGRPGRVAFLGVDGFQNFTELERELLLAMAAEAEETVVTLTIDPDLDPTDADPFAVARETRSFLLDRGFIERRLEENRRSRPAVLRRIERDLFRPGAEEGGPAHPDEFRVLVGADPSDEADRIARTIVRLVTREEDPRRYRDIVVIVRNVRARRQLLSSAFGRHGIPHRIYGSRELASHPYARSALRLLEVVAGRPERGAVLALLRSGHVDRVSMEAVDRLEYRTLEEGEPADLEAWIDFVAEDAGDVFEDAAEENAGIREFLVELHRVECPGEGAPAAGWILDLLGRHLAPLWERDPGVAEDLIRAEAAATTALVECVERVGEDLSAGGGSVSLSEFLDLLRSAVRSAGLPVGDRRLEVVNVIDAREARQWEAPVVFVAGLVEGEFPVNPKEDVFLSDEDRQTVNRAGTLALKERLLMREEERFLFYVAMTRAKESLFPTYSATDGAGRENLRSLYLDEVLRLFGEEHRGRIVSLRRLSDPLPEEAEAVHPEDARRRAMFGLSRPHRPDTDETDGARLAVALNDLLLDDEPYRRALALGARFRRPPPAVLEGPVFPGASRTHSASSLESFIRCPFQHFAGRVLRLDGPPRVARAGLDHLVLGEIVHEVLHRAFLPVLNGGEPLGDPELSALFGEEFRRRTRGIRIGVDEDRARRDLEAVLLEVMAAERRRLASSDHVPAMLEEEFGRRERKLALRGAGDRKAWLRGRVDRIDVSAAGDAVVIDYKYSKHGFDRGKRKEAEEGQYLQLPVYLLAARDAFGLRPVGAWLFPLRDPRTSGYRVAGGPAPDDALELGPEELDELLGRTVGVVLDLDERIRSGDISVRPRGADDCARCDFGDLCRIEPWQIGGEG